MTKQDYRLKIDAPISAPEAYDKIARVTEWWTKYVEGSTKNLGDVFTVRFGEDHGGTFVDFKITEAVPGSKVVWHVTNCYLPWLNDKTEWNGTSVVFEISERQGETTVTVTHEGLTPEVECFEMCEQGWNYYVGQSLKQFLTDGHGTPNQR